MNIIPELNLNRHPKDCKCYSLVDANNVRLSNDNSCLQSEESIIENNIINQFLTKTYQFGKLVGVIPCNKEVIIFWTIDDVASKYAIIRYNEDANKCKQYYTQKYNGGIIKGDFTYNAKDELIIAFCESEDDEHKLTEDSPLKTANLGVFDDTFVPIYEDNLVLNPISIFSKITNLDYINGVAKKGWYNFFIRYKIDKYNYTNWQPLGYPIYINSIEERSIIKLYSTASSVFDDISSTIGIGCTDYISTDSDVSNISISFSHTVVSQVYGYYQIGWICSNKTDVKGYRTDNLKSNSSNESTFELSYENAIEYTASELIKTTNNYYNVKCINSYKNRLYIGGYKEHYNPKSYFANYVNKIILGVKVSEIDLTSSYKTKTDAPVINIDENGNASSSAISDIRYFDCNKTFKDRLSKTTLIPDNLYKFYIHFVDKYGEATDGIEIPFNNNTTGFSKVIYNGNEYFHFTCPDVLYNKKHKVTQFELTIKLSENIELPDGYLTCFLSYEKIEQNQITGILCKYDFNDASYGYDKSVDNSYHFYTNELDIKDKINIDFNKLRVDATNIYSIKSNISLSSVAICKIKIYGLVGGDIYDTMHNLNTAEISENTTVKYINIEDTDINLRLGNDAKNKRDGLGTCIEIIDERSTGLKTLFSNVYSIHKVTLIGEPIIHNNSKELIKFTNYFIPSTTEELVDGHYNGFVTFNSALIYNANKVFFNDVNNSTYDTNGIYYNYALEDPNTIGSKAYDYKYKKPILNIQFYQYSEIMFETKSFKQEPANIITIVGQPKSDDTTIYSASTKIGCIIKPMNSIDLYKDVYGKVIENNHNPYYSYPINYDNASEFNKVVRRSAVIGDESLENSWRNFPIENYKVINENKGNITNIIGLGNTLLVHTEHSLFMFNADIKLSNTDGEDVNVTRADPFDIQYQEVFTSKLGSCGLQDRDAYIVDDFGYVYYDNDAKKIYKFTSKSIEEIDSSIINWLQRYAPRKVRFANDKESNRILLSMWYNNEDNNESNIILDYNFVLKGFVSKHSYKFDKATRTKNNLYYILGKTFYNINYNKLPADYSKFVNSDNNAAAKESNIKIIYNNEYELIKALEYISYKLYRAYNVYEKENAAMMINKEPYSGKSLEVFNNLIDTGTINIEINTEIDKNIIDNYKKPTWDLGNWNFNYLRDIKNGDVADTMARLYGNYFIINFTFGGTNVKYEFESLECAISKFR